MIQERLYFQTFLLQEKFYTDTINSTAEISAYLVGTMEAINSGINNHSTRNRGYNTPK